MNTRHTPFSPIPVLGESAHMFAVPDGIPADIAINQASAQLNAGVKTLFYALNDQRATPESAALWTAFYALEGAAALVEALVLGVEQSTRNSAAQEASA
jgi:hypothetical protein